MSLAAEMKDLLSAYQTVSGVQQKRQDSQQKGDYYQALIGQNKQKIDLQQQSLNQRAESLRNSNAARWAGIGLQRDRLNVYKDSLKNKNPDFSQPPPGTNLGGGFFGGGSGGTSAVPTGDSTSTPTNPGASSTTPQASQLPPGQD